MGGAGESETGGAAREADALPGTELRLQPVAGAMGLRRLELAAFRSYRRLVLTLDERPVVIVGPNGAGKTNLMEAVSLLSPGRGLRRAAPEDLALQGGQAWRIRSVVAEPGGRHEVAVEAQGAGRRVEIDGKAAPQAALAAVLRILWLTPAMDRLWTEAPAERRRFLDRATMSLTPAHAEAALAYERALRERNRLIRDGVCDATWFGVVEAQMAEHGARVRAGRRRALERLAAAQMPGPFPMAELALEADGPDAEEALAAALAAGRGRDVAAGRSLTGPHRDDFAATLAIKGVPARLASTGEQKALLLALTLANARAVAAAAGAVPILLLDEVAAHLDARRRDDLYAALRALGAQAWMTGTGAELFAGLTSDAQWIEVREQGGCSALAAVRRPGEGGGTMGSSRPFTGIANSKEAGMSDNPDKVPPGEAGAGENICRKCEGTGRVDGDKCPDCGGSGKVVTPIGGA